METIKYWYLRNHELFTQMNEAEIKGLCVISGFKRAQKNEVIYFTHETVKRIYLLKKGVIKIVASDEAGNEVTKEVMQPGDLFGEITLSHQVSRESEYAKAITDEVIICSFTLDDFEKVLEMNPAISLKYTRRVGDKLKALENRYTDLIFKDVRTRVVEFLKHYAQANGKLENNQLVVKNYLTHQDLASLTGATRQTVTSILNQLEKENKLLYSRSQITIPNPAELH
ncbi:MAG: Crp/Fnr family transcriptional regulator [Cytophagales bacterium]|nr:Crp/Fnr family transcriptional regulator [Cytophagales bacterium]